MSFDIQQMIDDPKFSKRISKSPNDVCALCLEEPSFDTDQCQIRCSARSCQYTLCHECMKHVFSFKYIGFYQCFICGTRYQLQDAEKILKERMSSLDDVTLRDSFSKLVKDLPKQFEPETIKMKQQQQREIASFKGIQKTITSCILNPNMTEQEAEDVRRRMPNIAEILESELHESNAVEEVGPNLSSTCVPTDNSSKSIKEENEKETITNRIWLAICDFLALIWDNVKRFNQFVGDIIVNVCKSLRRSTRHCPVSVRTELKQQLNKIEEHLKHSHDE